MKLNSRCTGCVYSYLVRSGSKSDWAMCDYIGHTGHARSLICPPGEGCTVRRTIADTDVAQFDRGGYIIRRKPKIDVERVREMAGRGIGDTEIAKVLGVSKDGVWRCRLKNNIPSGAPRKRRPE